ncbi:MAG: hypothetical protein AMXMBFR84_01930 [Candidatus Hydrogenedentota bacterium]
MSRMRLRLLRDGDARALAFTEYVQALHHAVGRAGLPVARGKHKYRLTPGPPLAQGQCSRCEYVDFELEDAITGIAFLKAFSPHLPPGVQAVSARRLPVDAPHLRAAVMGFVYAVHASLDAQKADEFRQRAEWPFSRDRQGRIQNFDLKRSVARLMTGPIETRMHVRVLPEGTPKPQEVIASIFDLSMETVERLTMVRIWVQLIPVRFASHE